MYTRVYEFAYLHMSVFTYTSIYEYVYMYERMFVYTDVVILSQGIYIP